MSKKDLDGFISDFRSNIEKKEKINNYLTDEKVSERREERHVPSCLFQLVENSIGLIDLDRHNWSHVLYNTSSERPCDYGY